MEYEIEKIKHQSEHEQQLLKTRLSNVLQQQHDVQSEANRKVEQYEFEMNTLRKKIGVVCCRLFGRVRRTNSCGVFVGRFVVVVDFVREQFKAIQHCCGTC